jgi:hypothetical protein
MHFEATSVQIACRVTMPTHFGCLIQLHFGQSLRLGTPNAYFTYSCNICHNFRSQIFKVLVHRLTRVFRLTFAFCPSHNFPPTACCWSVGRRYFRTLSLLEVHHQWSLRPRYSVTLVKLLRCASNWITRITSSQRGQLLLHFSSKTTVKVATYCLILR